jgi:hypothetical protein
MKFDLFLLRGIAKNKSSGSGFGSSQYDIVLLLGLLEVAKVLITLVIRRRLYFKSVCALHFSTISLVKKT